MLTRREFMWRLAWFCWGVTLGTALSKVLS